MSAAPLVTVVTSPGCHYCQDAERALAELGIAPDQVEHLDAESEQGRALLSRHRAPMLPLILLDGAFFSSGRLPRNKLSKHLRQQAAR